MPRCWIPRSCLLVGLIVPGEAGVRTQQPILFPGFSLEVCNSPQITRYGEYCNSMEDQDIIREFLIESGENLNRLDQEIVELERRPQDADLLASIFRTFHTIKGTCGFLGFGTLEAVTHQA